MEGDSPIRTISVDPSVLHYMSSVYDIHKAQKLAGAIL